MKLRLHPSLLDRLGVSPNADGSLTGAQVLDALTQALTKQRVPSADDQVYDALFPTAATTTVAPTARHADEENDAYYALFPDERP